MLVSRAGGTTDLTIIGSGAATGTSTHQWSDAFRVANPAIYAGYTSFFWRLARDIGRRDPHPHPVLRPVHRPDLSRQAG